MLNQSDRMDDVYHQIATSLDDKKPIIYIIMLNSNIVNPVVLGYILSSSSSPEEGWVINYSLLYVCIIK